VIAKCQAGPLELHDTGASTLHNLHRLAHANAKLFQSMDFIGLAYQLIDSRALADGEHLQRECIGHGGRTGGLRQATDRC
jgi:hypothetical protein